MRAYLPAYHLEEPRDLNDVLERLTREPGRWKLFAGGTDLMVLLEAGKLAHRNFLSVWKLPELRGIEVAPDTVTIGAGTTYTELRNNATLAREFPLPKACRVRDGRDRHTESRHHRRKHCQRFAGCGFSARVACIRRGDRIGFRARGAVAATARILLRVQADGFLRR